VVIELARGRRSRFTGYYRLLLNRVIEQEIRVVRGGFAKADATFTQQGYPFLVKEQFSLVVVDVTAICAVVHEYELTAIAFDFAMLARRLLRWND
jgi:hypothetical protein